jgi:hypothetical protein
MPTTAEFAALSAVINTTWTNDYQGSGVAGLICTDKTDNSKVLFFPAAGDYGYANIFDVNIKGHYWSSSLYAEDVIYAHRLIFGSDDLRWQVYNLRCFGYSIRAVVG